MAVATLALAASAACTSTPAVLTELSEVRRLASDMRVAFTKASDASNRAVMADTDDASAVAARESREHAARLQTILEQVEPHLHSLGYQEEIASLERFKVKLAEYRTLDDEILPLATENTNLKAQRLSFGEGQQAADAFVAALDSAAAASSTAESQVQASTAVKAVLGIQVVQARHIAEADNPSMDRMEQQMATLEQTAREAVGRLRSARSAPSSGALDTATAALDRFMAVNRDIVQLSRRNTNVRSLALSLGRKRVVVAECEDELNRLDEALARHSFDATR
ncbi:MAG: hypothetical protein ABL982_19820 [Vicinamibacterales bacterium]